MATPTRLVRSVLATLLLLAGCHAPSGPSAVSPMNADPAQPRSSRVADAGMPDVRVGVLPRGPLNAITDVAGVRVGHVTLIDGADVRTGVTAIVPHGGDVFREKVPAAIHVANGFGKLAGATQVQELGTIETPIVLTNTLSVAAGIDGLIDHALRRNPGIRSVNALVGETNDGVLNDIARRVVTREHVLRAIDEAVEGPVAEGSVGAGTGTVCFGFKGGIGTSSRRLPASLGGHTVGVIVQSNFGGVLQIAGVPVGEKLGQFSFSRELSAANASVDGSCMIVVATDAPLDAHALERLAKRAFMGLARTGGIASNGSGDYVIAFSAHAAVRVPHESKARTQTVEVLRADAMSPLFLAAIEATEEAIVRSLFAAEPMTGRGGKTVPALPRETVVPMLREAGVLR